MSESTVATERTQERPRRLRLPLVLFPFRRIITPATVTVFLTAVLGPIAIKVTADAAETRKLQAGLVQEILNYTKAANFNESGEVLRAAYLAKLVNENYDIFRLKFSEAEKDFANLARALEQAGIRKLEESQKLKSDSISLLRASGASAEQQIKSLEHERDSIASTLNGKIGAQRAEAERGIALREGQIRTLAAQRQANEVRLQQLRADYERETAALRVATNNIAALTAENQQRQADLASERSALASIRGELEQAREQNRSLTEQLERSANRVEAAEREAREATERNQEAERKLASEKALASARGDSIRNLLSAPASTGSQ